MTIVFDNLMTATVFILAYLIGHYGSHLLNSPRLVLANTVLFSLVFAWIASPDTLVFLLVMTAYAAVYVWLQSKRWFLYGALPVTLLFVAGRILSDQSLLAILFSSFIYIRTLGTVLWNWRYPKEIFRPVDVVLSLVFFPTLVVGPIQFADRINLPALCRFPTGAEFADGGKRIIIGIAKVAWLGPQITSQLPSVFAENADGSMGWLFWVFSVWAGLANIYVMFSGYVDIAVGVSRFVGVDSKENFNKPWLARTPQEFWQRWHMSLVWVTNNLGYHPYVRRTGRRYLGIVLAFTFIGAWHAFTWQYLVWGISHGLALAAIAWMQRNHRIRALWARSEQHRVLNLLLQGLGWFVTMTYVAALSDFATGEFG
ncbi:hypothetical protein [Microbaculum marinum]|uniref:MBOAT family protein n=1 Tax=Microbaculum marinum TaxID=1764581 RepID=A0AAW9RTX1_9HYPH